MSGYDNFMDTLSTLDTELATPETRVTVSLFEHDFTHINIKNHLHPMLSTLGITSPEEASSVEEGIKDFPVSNLVHLQRALLNIRYDCTITVISDIKGSLTIKDGDLVQLIVDEEDYTPVTTDSMYEYYTLYNLILSMLTPNVEMEITYPSEYVSLLEYDFDNGCIKSALTLTFSAIMNDATEDVDFKEMMEGYFKHFPASNLYKLEVALDSYSQGEFSVTIKGDSTVSITTDKYDIATLIIDGDDCSDCDGHPLQVIVTNLVIGLKTLDASVTVDGETYGGSV